MTITFKRVYIRNYASPYHATIMYAHEMQKLRNKTKARREETRDKTKARREETTL